MNWAQRLNDIKLEIETGDGQKFYPLWKDAKKSIKYNTEGFDFVGVEGTYVERKKQSGNKFPILLYFHGEDCIEQTRKFEYAARDSRPWTIHHPVYDAILVQPLNLEIDNSVYNISKITGVVWETINYKYPLYKLNVRITIVQISSDINTRAEEVFENKAPTDSSAIEPAVISSRMIGKKYDVLTDVLEKVNILKDLVRKASSAAQYVLERPAFFMKQIQNLVDFPFIIKQSIEFKLTQLIETYNDTRALFVEKEEFEMFEAFACSIVGTACKVASTPEAGDYKTRQDVLNAIDSIVNLNSSIIQTFDGTSLGPVISAAGVAYEPDADLAFNLDKIVNLTVANLYEIAYNSKQERTTILEEDDNIVNLAHKYYGSGDDNLQDFMDANNLSFDEITHIPKGRKIVWYI